MTIEWPWDHLDRPVLVNYCPMLVAPENERLGRCIPSSGVHGLQIEDFDTLWHSLHTGDQKCPRIASICSSTCFSKSRAIEGTTLIMDLCQCDDGCVSLHRFSSGKYPFTFLLFYFLKKKRRVFLCFTPPENEYGNQVFSDSMFLVDFLTF